MREIKFRAWDGKKIHTQQSVGELRDFAGLSQFFGFLMFCDSPILMQSTGLKDKNGKEIWEGDIVAWNKAGKQFTGKVEYDKGRFWVYDFFIASFDDPSDAFGEGIGMLQVIGNIYENPELLQIKDK